jgi:D-sedoheptulose 7-phosphate isomerase
MEFTEQHLNETVQVINLIDPIQIDSAIIRLVKLRNEGGRLFIIGVGGSAANASHAVNDFRKISGIESYSPTDNVSEITARTNDEGWETTFIEWLKTSNLSNKDCLMVLSVGGGDLERNISSNIVRAVAFANERQADIIGIVGRDGGYTAKNAAYAILIPTVNPDSVTPHSESMQAVVWHLMVSHPLLSLKSAKWESSL